MSDTIDILNSINLDGYAKAVRMNASNFKNVLTEADYKNFEPFTAIAIIKTGLYGTYHGMEIHVSRDVPLDHFQFKTKLDQNWTLDISFNLLKQANLSRLLELKGFW